MVLTTLLLVLAAVTAQQARAGLLSSVTKLTTTTTSTVTSTTQPVTNTATTSGTTATTTSTSTGTLLGTLGTVTSTTTTAVSNTVNTTIQTVEGTTTVTPVVSATVSLGEDALNVIPAGYDPFTPLAELIGSTSGLPNLIEGILCPPLTEVVELLNAVTGSAIGDGLVSLVCSASVLEYKFFTRFRNADGSHTERTHVATLGVPQALDVDGDIAPDLIGTITLTGVNSVGLTIDRFPTETATLPVSVEAVLRDPTGGAFGREFVAFGYDARHDRAPDRFVLSTPVNTILAPSPEFTATIAQTGRGEQIALLGGLFDGTPAQRANPAEVRLDYRKSPDNATVTARFGDDQVHAQLTTNRPGRTEITGRIVEATEEQRFTANLTDMPSSFAVDVSQADGVDATLTSSAPIGRIDGTFERLRNIGPSPIVLEKALVDLTSVPVGVRVRMSGDDGAITTTGGPIGRVKVGVANGEPAFLSGEPAYAYVSDDGAVQSVAAEIPGLRSATFTLGGAPQLSAEIAATPFLARIVEPGRTIDARILDLPSRFDIGIDLEGGTLSYDGHGSGIDRILLTGDSVEPFFGRATKLRGTIEGIPAAMTATLALGEGTGEVRVDGGGAIDTIELIASNGPEELPAGTGQGVIFRDLTGGDFLVSARLLGLRRIAFANADVLSLDTHTAGGPFTIVAQTNEFTVNGTVRDLPAKSAITASLENSSISFRGRTADDQPAGIDMLDLDLVATDALFGRADHLDAHIEDIPADLTLSLAQGAGGTEILAPEGIGLIEIIAANRLPAAGDLPAGGEQGAKFTDLTGGEFVVAARVRQLKRLAANIGDDLVALSTETQGGPFGVDLRTDDLTGAARIEDLPAKLDVGLDLDAGRLTATSRDASGNPQRINRITLDLESDAALFGRATVIDATIEGIPSDLVLDIAQNGAGALIEGNEAIDLIELVAANRAPQADDLPAGGAQGAKLVDLDNGEFVLGARVRQLKRLQASFGTPITINAITAGGPFGLRVTTDDLTALAQILDLPANLTATLDLDGGVMSVVGRNAAGDPQGIDLLTLDLRGAQPLFGRATDVNARIEGIPSDVTLNLATDGTGVGIEANEAIDLIELVAANRAIPDPAADLPAGGAMGATYIDTSSAFVLSARVRELKKLDATLGDSINLEALTAGGPFLVNLETEDLRADAQLLDLPADVLVDFDAAAGTLTYRGKTASGDPAGIGLLTLNVDSDTPLFGRATDISARIEDLAPSVDLTIDTANAAGPRINVAASSPISLLEFLATDDGSTAFPVPLDVAGVQGAVLKDRTGDPFVAAVRILQLRGMALEFAGDTITVDAQTAGSPFAVEVDTDDFAISGRILDLPADANLSVNLADGQVTFEGMDAAGNPEGIDLLTISGRLAQPFLGRANRVSARIERLPANVDLGFSQDAGTASINASAPIQLIELFAWEDGDPQPTLAADQGALLHDRAGQPYQLAARIRQLEQLTVAFGEAVQLTTKTAGGLFVADILTDTLDADATIDQLPTELSLGLDLASGQVTYAGSAPINRIFAAIDSVDPVFLGATAFEVDLQQVPTSFALNLGSDLDNIQLSADNPIGQIDVRARSANRTYPVIPVGEAGATLDATNDELSLALRVFQLKTLSVDLDPITLDAEMQSGRKFTVDAKLDQDGSPTPLELDAVIDTLPSVISLGLEELANGSQIVVNGNAPIGFVRLATEGLELLPGASKVEAELNSIPEKLTVALPETGSLAKIEARNAANVLTPIGQIRLAASNGSKTLPAFVSDAQYNSNPSNTAFRDRLEFDNTTTSFGVAVRLTAVKLIDINLDPIALTLEQDAARTRPIAIAATIPNSTAGQPATTVNGVLNKPSARTVLGVTLVPGQPTRLTFENAAAVASLTLNATNLGSIPAANFTLSNIPTRLAICMNTNSACRRTDRLPTALSDYGGQGRTPAQDSEAGGQRRPYPAQVSMDFDDFGTTGNSSAISSMVTVNASITLTAGATPITITNLRFHGLSMDLGQHPTSPTFSFLGSNVPRIYMYIDSFAKPFVMNEIKYPPTIETFRIGTDTSPANANLRLVWLPGTRCASIILGACIGSVLDPRSNGSLSCGGQRNLTIKVLGININLLDFLGLQILPVCS